MTQVVKRLEVLLGPDTADLLMRFGLHSGPVTAGVLRGEKSRFQVSFRGPIRCVSLRLFFISYLIKFLRNICILYM